MVVLFVSQSITQSIAGNFHVAVRDCLILENIFSMAILVPSANELAIRGVMPCFAAKASRVSRAHNILSK